MGLNFAQKTESKFMFARQTWQPGSETKSMEGCCLISANWKFSLMALTDLTKEA